MTAEREVAETRMAQSVQGGQEMQPEYIGELVAQAIRDEQYLILPDEFHAELVRRRSHDLNGFVQGRLRS
jgi:hypothetical protein